MQKSKGQVILDAGFQQVPALVKNVKNFHNIAM